MGTTELIELIERTAQVRQETPVPREFIIEALARIAEGKETVETYPTGVPSLTETYEVAKRLFKESNSAEP